MKRRRSLQRLEAALRRILIRFWPSAFLLLCRPRRSELGEVGEELVARHLRAQGWQLVGRRMRSPHGEIDVVARRAGICACVEVKTGRLPRDGGLPSGHDPRQWRWRPGHRLSARRLQLQRRAARWFADGSEHARVDLIEVCLMPQAPRVRILHHPDLTRPLRCDRGGEQGASRGFQGRPIE